jgi:hypothetical protein
MAKRAGRGFCLQQWEQVLHEPMRGHAGGKQDEVGGKVAGRSVGEGDRQCRLRGRV